MSRKNNSPEWILFCARAEFPAKVKKMSKTIELVPEWESIKITVMFEVLRIKFAIPEMRRMLLATGDSYIQEGNSHHDEFWGVNLETGVGLNYLGKTLMAIRNEIRTNNGVV